MYCLAPVVGNNLVLLSSNKGDLQYTFDRFSNASLNAGMKSSMAKTEIMHVKDSCSVFFLNKWSNSSADEEV